MFGLFLINFQLAVLLHVGRIDTQCGECITEETCEIVRMISHDNLQCILHLGGILLDLLKESLILIDDLLNLALESTLAWTSIARCTLGSSRLWLLLLGLFLGHMLGLDDLLVSICGNMEE